MTLRRRRCVALAALAATAACAGADEPRDAAVAARDSRFVISYVASAPASREASGRLRIRVELQDSWHVAPDVPATLKLEGSPGLELEPAEQRAEDAVQRSPDALEFASAFRTASAGEALVRGRIKFGICEGEDERCVIVRRELELPLEIAFRD